MDALTQAIRHEVRMRLAERGRMRAFAYGVVSATIGITLLLAAAIAYATTVPRAAYEYRRDLIRESRAVWGLDAPVATLAGQIHQESYWQPDARSRVGASGLAQFMPATSRWISGLYAELADNEPTNPRWALRAQSRYMRWLHARVRADDACEQMAFALSAYNGGLGRVYARQKLSAEPGRCLGSTCTINPGIAPYNQRENEHYSRVILLQHAPAYSRDGWGPEVC